MAKKRCTTVHALSDRHDTSSVRHVPSLLCVDIALRFPNDASAEELSNALHFAVEIGKLEAVPVLLQHGADASTRGRGGQLVHATLLQCASDKWVPARIEAAAALFAAHCEIDAQIGVSLDRTGSKASQVIEEVLFQMVESQWLSSSDSSTVAHKLLFACSTSKISEDTTIKILQTVLDCHPELLNAPNARGVTPTDIALQSTHCLRLQRKFTIILFGDYQIPNPATPMCKFAPLRINTRRVKVVLTGKPHVKS